MKAAISLLLCCLPQMVLAGFDYVVTEGYFWDITLRGEQSLLVLGGGLSD